MNALQIEGVVAPKKPIVGTLPRCCAHAGYGLTRGASAAPPSSVMNSRRLTASIGLPATGCVFPIVSNQSEASHRPLWSSAEHNTNTSVEAYRYPPFSQRGFA